MGACPTRLIADSPAETDAFGSHERVAQAIADLVLNEEEVGKICFCSNLDGFYERRVCPNEMR